MRDEDSRYLVLTNVFQHAYERATVGKGKERHEGVRHLNFTDQGIVTELIEMGITPALYQIRKKAMECLRLSDYQRQQELLDIIIYAAAAFISLEKENEVSEM